MINVLIADDQVLGRRGLRQMLSRDDEISPSREAACWQEVLDEMKTHQFDVLLLSFEPPRHDCIEILTQLRKLPSKPPVIILNNLPERHDVMRSLKLGADGFLVKSGNLDQELIEAIHKVVRGGRYISEQLLEGLMDDITTENSDQPHLNLSDREFQILIHLARGESISEIAQTLKLSSKTITTYRFRMLKKMGMHNNAEVVRYAIERKFI